MSSDSSRNPEVSASTILSAIRSPHTTFAAGRRFAHVPRAAHIRQLFDHVESSDPPLLLTAPSGAGKSALLSYWAQEYRKQSPGSLLIEHYVGCSEDAATHFDLVRHIMLEIKTHYRIPQELPPTPSLLIREFPAWLWYIRDPSVLIIDGLDQLREGTPILDWIPDSLPEHCRIICSATQDHEVARTAPSKWPRLQITALSPDERRNVVQRFVRERKLEVSTTTLQNFADDRHSANPLLLRVRLEEATVIRKDRPDDEVIAGYLSAPTIDNLFEQLLSQLQNRFGAELVASLFGYISAARSPFTRSELEELLGSPPKLVELLQRLTFYIGGEQDTVRYYHQALRKVADSLFFSNSGRQRTIRCSLLSWLQQQELSTRTALETAEQLSHLDNGMELGEFLTRPDILHTLYQPATASHYLQYLQRAQQPGQQNPAELLEHALQEVEEEEILQAAGDVCRLTGATHAAARIYEKMLAVIRQQTPEPERLARAYSRMGTIQELLGHPGKAGEAMHHALHHALQTSGNALLIATIRGNIGNILYRNGEFTTALEMHRLNLRAAEEANDIFSTARVLNNLGSTYQRLGEQKNAQECFERARQLVARTGNKILLAQVAGNLAAIKSEQGNLTEALELCREQLEAAEQTGRKRFMVIAHITSGNILLKQNRWQDAHVHYAEARAIAEEADIPLLQGVAMDGLGRCHIQAREYSAATDLLNRALEIFRTCEDPHRTNASLEALASLDYRRGRYQSALKGFRAVFTAYQRMGLRRMLLGISLEIGQTLLRLGQLENAEKELAFLLENAQVLEDTTSISLAHFHRGVVFVEREELDRAFSSFHAGLKTLRPLASDSSTAQATFFPLFAAVLRTALLYLASRTSHSSSSQKEPCGFTELTEYILSCSAEDSELKFYRNLFVWATRTGIEPESWQTVLSGTASNDETLAEGTFIVGRLLAHSGCRKKAQFFFDRAHSQYTDLLAQTPETQLFAVRLGRSL